MIGGADADDDAADERFEARRRQRRDAAIAALPPELLVALAGAPFWTAPALTAAGLDLGRTLEEAGALVVREGLDDDTTIALERDDVEEVVRQAYARSHRAPAEALADLGDRIAAVEDAPPVLAHWASLARSLRGGAGPAAAADELLARVQALCEANQLGEASELLEAAGALARTVGGPLAVAERIGRHRLERQFRAARDRRHLRSFVGRDDAMAAFRRLLAEDGPWALHYVGVGGAGKTTFIRHLAVDQAAALGLSVAQIDFDYLSPAYPGRDPGQLVQAIVHELTIHVDRIEQDRWLQSIHEQLERLRAVAQDVRTGDPLGPIAWPEFQELLGFVSSFLQSFPHPVIVLDTCEELMKLSPVGRTIPSVEATFRLIEKLHDRVPQLRVLFAGRRLLAAGGDGWTASPQAMTQPLSRERPYLMLHELRGMTPEEAGAVLDRLLPERRRGDERLRRAILDACPEDGRVNGLVHAANANANADAPRFSPFRLVRLARWVAAEPDLPADRLEHGADPYIEQRVVQRVGALEPLLPTIVLLRRFDARTLARVRGQPEEDARATLRELAGHEWIYAHDYPERGLVVEVKPSLRDQLERYLQERRGPELREASEAIARALAPMLEEPEIVQRPPERIDAALPPTWAPVISTSAVQQPPELIDAALRALPGLAAVRAWFVLEAGIGREWWSALTLTRFLLGEGNAAEDGASILGCAVRATHLSALIHEHPEVDVGEQWRQIADAMAPREQIATVRMLRCRARLGAIAAEGWRGTADPDDLARELEEVVQIMGVRPPPVAATWVIAAVEGLLERLERSYVRCKSLERIIEPSWWAPLSLSRALEAWLAILRTRAAVLLGYPRARVHALTPLALATADLELPATCLDWLPPASLRDRIRLEVLRLSFHLLIDYEVKERSGSEGKLDLSMSLVQRRGAAWLGELSQDAEPWTDDGDRLASACVLLEAATRGALIAAETRKVKRRAWGLREPAVYRRFPPAAVTFAMLQWDATTVPADVSPIDAVRIRLARARRTRDRSLLATEVTQSSSGRLFIETAQAAALVLERVEPVPAGLTDPVEVIDHWSYQRAITRAELEAAVDGMRPYVESLVALVRSDDPMIAARALATLEQVIELARYTAEPLAVVPRSRRRAPTHPDQVETMVRLELQAAAAQSTFRMPEALAEIKPALPGMVARLAVEEAELLSLRFPDRAARLFEYAERELMRLGCETEAKLAGLGRVTSLRMLGGSQDGPVIAGPSGPVMPVPMPVEYEMLLVGTGTRLQRTRVRKPSIRRRAKAWAKRYRDELLLALGLGFGAIALVAGWLLLDRLLLPAARDVVAIPESSVSTAIALALGFGVLLLIRRLKYSELRESAAWRSLQVIRPWRYRLALQVLAERDGLKIVVERRVGRESWLAPKPGAGQIPALATSAEDRARVAALRDEIAEQRPLPVVARAEIARAATAAAWEASLVKDLPNLVIWRAVRRSTTVRTSRDEHARGTDTSQPMTPRAPTYVEAQIAKAWLAGCEVPELGLVQGIAHLVGRPRRLVGSIDLERTHPGDRATLPGRSELAERRLDDLDVVLQLAPQGHDQASAATRTELGLLRELAGSLIERGARSVLVIPAVSQDRVHDVVAAVARALGRAPERKLARLVEAARRCRAAIAGITFADHRIVADEVTLFVAVTDPTRE